MARMEMAKAITIEHMVAQNETEQRETRAPMSMSTSRTSVEKEMKVKTNHYGTHQIYICFVLILFAGSSLGAIFINKTCLTGYHFRYPMTLVLGQMIFAVVLLSLLNMSGLVRIQRASSQGLLTLALPTALFTSNVVVGLSALSLVNIPMFSAFRRLTLVFVIGAEYVFLNKKHSSGIVKSVILMTIGAFVSAVDDVTFSRVGYFLVFLNNVLTAGYLASLKQVMSDTRFDSLSLLYYIALLGMPFVAGLVILSGELANVVVAFRTQPELGSWGFLVSVGLTASGAFMVNISTSICTEVTSPLTTSVAGQVKNVVQTMLGVFSWGFVPTKMNFAGLLVALGAQGWFVYLKYEENREKYETKREDETEVMKIRRVERAEGEALHLMIAAK